MCELTTIRIERESLLPGDTSNHRSEISLPVSEKENLVYNKDSYYNFEVHNKGTLEEFYKKLVNVSSHLSSKLVSY